MFRDKTETLHTLTPLPPGKRGGVVPFVYIALSIADIATGAVALFHALLFTLYIARMYTTVLWMMVILYFITSLTARASTFYNILLCIIRSVNIIKPFMLIRLRYIMVLVIVYPCLWLPLIAYEFSLFELGNIIIRDKLTAWRASVLLYYPIPGYITIERYILEPQNNFSILFSVLFTFLPPTLIAIVCTTIQSYTLLHNTMQPRASTTSVINKSTDTQRKITITIVQLTALYVFTNTALMAWLFVVTLNPYVKKHFLNDFDMFDQLTYTFCTLFPLVNATLNPLILISRSDTLTEYLKRIINIRRFVNYFDKTPVGAVGDNSIYNINMEELNKCKSGDVTPVR